MVGSQTDMKALLYRRELAAMRLGISLRSLDELLAQNQIASVRIGKRRLVSEEAILHFIKKREKC
jgi:excisionase family DNA binding protein